MLADIYGRKKVMLIVYYIFTVAATASAFSWSYPVFLILRGVAGEDNFHETCCNRTISTIFKKVVGNINMCFHFKF